MTVITEGPNAISGKNGEWHTTLGATYAGKTVKMILTPDPAKAAEVDQTPIVVSDTVS